MLTWAGILKALLGLASTIAGYLRERQLLDAGEAKAVARLSAEEQERVDAANRAALRARDADRVPDSAFRD